MRPVATVWPNPDGRKRPGSAPIPPPDQRESVPERHARAPQIVSAKRLGKHPSAHCLPRSHERRTIPLATRRIDADVRRHRPLDRVRGQVRLRRAGAPVLREREVPQEGDPSRARVAHERLHARREAQHAVWRIGNSDNLPGPVDSARSIRGTGHEANPRLQRNRRPGATQSRRDLPGGAGDTDVARCGHARLCRAKLFQPGLPALVWHDAWRAAPRLAAATREDASQGGALRSRLTCSWMEKSTTRPSPASLPVTRALEAAMHFPRRSSQQPSLTAP